MSQHNAAFALYGLSDNEDNLVEFVKEGAVQRIKECDLIVQVRPACCTGLLLLPSLPTLCLLGALLLLPVAKTLCCPAPRAPVLQASKDCVEKTIKRLRDKLKDRILGQILYIMQVGFQRSQLCLLTAVCYVGHSCLAP